MRSTILAALVAVLLAPAARAELDLAVSADRPTRVYIGNEFVGDAPLTLRNLQPGTVMVLVEEAASGLTRTYMVPSPEQFLVERRLVVTWASEAPPPPGISYRAGPPPPPPPPTQPPPRAESRGKTHTRNALIGATVFSQVLTKDGRDRKRQRNVGLGAIGLNEILRR